MSCIIITSCIPDCIKIYSVAPEAIIIQSDDEIYENICEEECDPEIEEC